MNRLNQLDPAKASGDTKMMFADVQAKLGSVPNMFRIFGNSPSALKGYLAFSGALVAGVLNARVREQIALAVAEINDCDYCLSAHTLLGRMSGLTGTEIDNARRVQSADERSTSILQLARTIVVKRGELNDEDLAAARAAGLTDSEIVETVANVALNILTNYLNRVAKTVLDFPPVKAGVFTEGSN
ncbi:carboxymuconolactone decarboxylase family protein [Geothrix sp. 21YS21S-2]|uniref:carboxymuconolactone decarboxylase family protein n=1 Tax=Geothrix sp. 21YS21S-2 TaxID=3068893 RepID=UPI0027B9BA7D|nr:carboxymuconolactone decarboxylase family protein [Geothrix sp. 21YS21S-2]